MVATKPGQHLDHSTPSYNAKFVSAASFTTRASATVCNIDSRSKVLNLPYTKKPYWTLKMNIQLLEALVDRFNPYREILIDHYSRTMITALAALGNFRNIL